MNTKKNYDEALLFAEKLVNVRGLRRVKNNMSFAKAVWSFLFFSACFDLQNEVKKSDFDTIFLKFLKWNAFTMY